MVLMDGKSRIRTCFGPYSPKLYDGTWIENNKKWLETNLEGVYVAADTHFVSTRKLQGVKNFVPYSKAEKIYKSKEKYSVQLRKIRSLVENPFGLIKTKFGSLSKPFPEGAEQLGYLVNYSIEIFNFEK